MKKILDELSRLNPSVWKYYQFQIHFSRVVEWEKSLADSYIKETLNTTFISEAFTNPERNKLIADSPNCYITLPFFEDIFDVTESHYFVANNVMETELTRWAANGNDFELDPSLMVVLIRTNLR